MNVAGREFLGRPHIQNHEVGVLLFHALHEMVGRDLPARDVRGVDRRTCELPAHKQAE